MGTLKAPAPATISLFSLPVVVLGALPVALATAGTRDGLPWNFDKNSFLVTRWNWMSVP